MNAINAAFSALNVTIQAASVIPRNYAKPIEWAAEMLIIGERNP
jgi:hypothetical protein